MTGPGPASVRRPTGSSPRRPELSVNVNDRYWTGRVPPGASDRRQDRNGSGGRERRGVERQGSCRRPPPRPLQVGGALQHHARRVDGHDRHLDHADRPARHLPGHPPRPARPGQQLLPAVDDPQLHGGHQRAGGQPGPAGRHVRPGEDVQPRLRRLHLLLAAAHHHLDERHRRRPVAGRSCGSSRASARRSSSPTPRPSSPTPSPRTSGAWRSGINQVAGHQRVVHRPRPGRHARPRSTGG